jgi:DNA-binding transcriptional LysR family regulator
MINAALFPALETLLAVARTGSVGAAARQQNITSSAVSQQIRRLETHFDIKLFERAGRGVRLTAAGEAALPVVRELWNGAESAFGQLAELAGRPATTLRVAASDYLGKGLLAPVFRDLLDEDPPARFEIVTTHSRAGVRLVASGEVDLAVVTGQETPRGLEERHLFDQPFSGWGRDAGGRRAPGAAAPRARAGLAAESRGPRSSRPGRAHPPAGKTPVCAGVSGELAPPRPARRGAPSRRRPRAVLPVRPAPAALGAR